MKSLYIYAYLLVIIANVSCLEKQVPITEEFFIDKSAIEFVNIPKFNYSDSSEIFFEANGLYRRQGAMYTQTSGKYSVENDTLQIHYACQARCSEHYCGIQRYVVKEDGKLHLVFLRRSDGSIPDLSETSLDKKLEFR